MGRLQAWSPYRDNLDTYLLKREKWAVDATLEAWERVVSTSQSKARARVKVDNAN